MKLKNHINAILDISKASNPDRFSSAVDMFLNNIKDAHVPDDQYHYAGADYVDYKELHPFHKEMHESKNDFVAFIEPLLPEIHRLRNEGKRDEAAALVLKDVEQ